MSFMRVITEAYGSDEGMKLWDAISSTLDPAIKGEIFFAMLTGAYMGDIRIHSFHPSANKINVIKAIRECSGLGLKEAKDLADSVWSGTPISLAVEPHRKEQAVAILKNVGCFL